MLSAIKSFFDENILKSSDSQSDEHAIKLASAALMIEMMRMDDDIQEQEQSVILQALQDKFELSQKESQDLMNLAQEELKDSTDYYQFTSLINNSFEYEERVHMIELLWQVAYADNQLDKDEEYLVRKVAELICVKHDDFITTKLRTRGSL